MSYPLSRHRCWAHSSPPQDAPPLCFPRSAPAAWYRKHSLQPPPRSVAPCSRQPERSACCPPCPGPLGLRPTESPQNGLSPWHNRQPATPNPLRPVTHAPRPTQPRYVPAGPTPPNAGRFCGWCCRPPDFRVGWFHWQPARIRKIMQSRIRLGLARLRPVDLGASIFRMTGCICSHRPSGISHILGRVSLFPIIHHHTRFPYLNQTVIAFSISDRLSFEIIS